MLPQFFLDYGIVCLCVVEVLFLNGAIPGDCDHLTKHCVKPVNQTIQGRRTGGTQGINLQGPKVWTGPRKLLVMIILKSRGGLRDRPGRGPEFCAEPLKLFVKWKCHTRFNYLIPKTQQHHTGT